MSDPSSAPVETSASPTRVTDWRRTPLGVVPRHLQQWVLVGVALVMVGSLALSGPPAKPRTTAALSSTPAAIDPNQQRIEEYQRRIQEQTQRLAAEQAQLQLTKQAVVRSPDTRPTGSVPRIDADIQTGATSAPPERAAREDRARFADNVAFSRSRAAFGAEPSGTPREPTNAALPDVAPVVPAPPIIAPPPLVDPSGARLSVSAAVPARQATPPLAPTPTPASGDAPRYRVFEGTLIETVLTNRLDGTFNGPVNCLVSVPVYASDQQHLLIPAGARVLGEARAVNTFGQSRLAVVFHRVILPNGTRVDLDGFHGLNQVGDLGLRDQVDRHYAQIFGVSLAIGAIAGFAQAQSAVGVDATGLDTYRQGVAANVSQSSARILDRFLNLLPTVTIREGHRIKVYLSNDLELPAYRAEFPVTGGRP